MAMAKRQIVTCLVAALCGSLGCIGSIGGADDEQTGLSADPLCSELTLADSLGPSPMQRLTRTELNNTFAELFGDTSHLADALPEDDRVGPFESNTLTSVTDHTVY